MNHFRASATRQWTDFVDTTGFPRWRTGTSHAVVDRASAPGARDRVDRGEGNVCARLRNGPRRTSVSATAFRINGLGSANPHALGMSERCRVDGVQHIVVAYRQHFANP